MSTHAEARSVAPAISARTDQGSGALIGYLPVGFPSLEQSVEAAVTLVDNGFDAVELGLPYSDPTMDGPIIQAATQTALADGFRTADVFRAVERITARVNAPVLAMTYWNPVLQYGVASFARDLAQAGGAGLITPDLIYDEADEWIAASDEHDLDRVFLAAPTSSDDRLKSIVAHSRGFVYTVSTMGTTGTRDDVDSAAQTLVRRLRRAGCERACVGLGISRPEHVAEVTSYADGAIVGSALVRALADGGASALAGLARDLDSGRAHTR